MNIEKGFNKEDNINSLIKEKIEKMYRAYNDYMSEHSLPEDIRKEVDSKIEKWQSIVEPKINLLGDRQEALETLENFIKGLEDASGRRFKIE